MVKVEKRLARKRRNKGVPVSPGERFFDGVMVVICLIMAVIMLYPVLYILKQSLSSADTVGLASVSLIPKEFSLDGYRYIFKTRYIWTGYANTIFRTVISTVLGLILAIGYAYPLSKKDLPFRNLLTYFIVVTMFVSGGLIPRYLLIRNLGLYDSRWALILPGLAKAYNLVIMRNFFMSLPDDLAEAAEIDGCSQIGVLFRIILPISKPIIATIGLWIVVDNWNAWFDSLLYINSADKLVLQAVLRRIIFDSSNELADMSAMVQQHISMDVVKYATIIVATVPVLCVYPFLQKYFVQGIMVGSLKG